MIQITTDSSSEIMVVIRKWNKTLEGWKKKKLGQEFYTQNMYL